MWFRDDVERVLLAVDRANLDIAQRIPTQEMALYRAGFEAAIEATAGAFGIVYNRPQQRQIGREVTR